MNELERAVRDYQRAGEALTESRERLAQAIAKAARAGVKQVEICRVTGYTRESVRRICRAAGVTAE